MLTATAPTGAVKTIASTATVRTWKQLWTNNVCKFHSSIAKFLNAQKSGQK